MVQVKKDAVRNRILETADRLFREKGYIASTMGQIAKEAQMASSAIYVYFPSKLAIAIAIFEPQIIAKMDEIHAEAIQIADKRSRLLYVLKSLWEDIPNENNNNINNLMQALVISSRDDDYEPRILTQMKWRVAAMVESCLPPERLEALDVAAVAHLLVMAFDGFVINSHLNPHEEGRGRLIKAACEMILGPPAQAASDAQTAPRKRIHKRT